MNTLKKLIKEELEGKPDIDRVLRAASTKIDDALSQAEQQLQSLVGRRVKLRDSGATDTIVDIEVYVDLGAVVVSCDLKNQRSSVVPEMFDFVD